MLCALVMLVLKDQGNEAMCHHGNGDACLTLAQCWNEAVRAPWPSFQVRDRCSGREALRLRANGPRRHKERAVVIPSYDIIVTADKRNEIDIILSRKPRWVIY